MCETSCVVEVPRLLCGRYRLIEPIGEGGMSVVWRAYDEVLRRRVAVKLLLAAEPRAGGRLHAEAQAAALLSHPNVSAVYDYGVADDEPFVVMELVDGTPLAARVARGPLPWRRAVEVCAQVAAALSAAHARGLVHRDVTPGNIMLTEAGVKVVDFGIAAIVGSPPDGSIIGTPPYLAPERLAGEVGGLAADVYALGVVLFVALTGHLPWPARSRAELLRGDLTPTPLPLIPGMPLEVAALYQDCLAADPGIRPSSASLARRLAALAGVRVGAVDSEPMSSPTGPQTLTGTRELTPTPPPRRGLRGRRAAVKMAMVGAAVAVVVAAAAFGTARSGGFGASGVSASAPGSAGGAGVSAPSCSVAYQVKAVWANGATVSLSITNTGETDIGRWALSFDVRGTLMPQSSWNSTWQQQGERVTVVGPPGSAALAAGKSTSNFGANLSGPDAANGSPGSFVLNGVQCQTTSQRA